MPIIALVIVRDVDANVAAGGMRAKCSIRLIDGTNAIDDEYTPYADINVLTPLQINGAIRNWAKQWTIDNWATEYGVGDTVALIHLVDMI